MGVGLILQCLQKYVITETGETGCSRTALLMKGIVVFCVPIKLYFFIFCIDFQQVEVPPDAPPPAKNIRLKIPRPMSMREVNLIASRQLFLLRNIEKVKRIRQRMLRKQKGEKIGDVVGGKPTNSKDNGKGKCTYHCCYDLQTSSLFCVMD